MPTGVLMTRPAESGIEWHMEMNSMLNAPKSNLAPGWTAWITVLWTRDSLSLTWIRPWGSGAQ